MVLTKMKEIAQVGGWCGDARAGCGRGPHQPRPATPPTWPHSRASSSELAGHARAAARPAQLAKHMRRQRASALAAADPPPPPPAARLPCRSTWVPTRP